MTEYREGYPKQVGWYDVLNNGEEDRLLFRICRSQNRYEWKDINGIRQEGDIRWTGEAGAYP